MGDNMEKWRKLAIDCNQVERSLYEKYDVKRGLRDLNGQGVLAGLTRIGAVESVEHKDGIAQAIPGRLKYRGVNIEDLVAGFISENRKGFEETIYLLLFGQLPDMAELEEFKAEICRQRALPDFFINDMIMRSPSKDIMNVLARSVLSLYSYDDNPDDISVENLLRQSIQLISQLSLLAVYGYQAFTHYHGDNSLVIHNPRMDLSIAENILYMLRADNQYTLLEAELLDLALVLHAEHGGGNNSTFTTHVVSSSGTDTYCAIASAIGSLKGPRHGGANLKVAAMFDDLKANVADWNDESAIEDYLTKLLNKQAFDNQGLIYGVGHAVYSISDPRAVIFKKYVGELACEKGLQEEFELYERVEKLAPVVISKHRRMYKGVSINVDFYSGFVYRMLNIPLELYTPLFAVSRIAGWCAHRVEEIVNEGKIIRPAYRAVSTDIDYEPLHKRTK